MKTIVRLLWCSLLLPLLAVAEPAQELKSMDDEVQDLKKQVLQLMKHFQRGRITEKERYNKVLDIWTHAREEITKGMDRMEAAFSGQEKTRENKLQRQQAAKLDNMFESMAAGEKKTLNVVVKADVRGSLEAIQSALEWGEFDRLDTLLETHADALSALEPRGRAYIDGLLEPRAGGVVLVRVLKDGSDVVTKSESSNALRNPSRRRFPKPRNFSSIALLRLLRL